MTEAEIKPVALSREEILNLPNTAFDLSPVFGELDAYTPPKGCFLVVKDQGKFAACAGFKPAPDLGEQVCEMAHFVISPMYRGRGLGSRLMRALLAQARAAGYRKISSCVMTWCPDWRAFYRAHGFAYVESPREDRETRAELALA